MRVIALAAAPLVVVIAASCAPTSDGCASGCPAGTACDVVEDECVAVASALGPTPAPDAAPAEPAHTSALTGTAASERPLVAMPRSCADVIAQNPSAPSGPTTIAAKDGSALTVVCDQATDGGGFTVVADVNWSIIDTSSCPSGWTWTIAGCAHDAGVDVVADARFDVPVPYSGEVRGRVIGTINDSNHAFADDDDIRVDQIYVDGLSITAGGGHAHVFTFAAATTIPGIFTSHDDCPGEFGNGPPAFVGDGFHCDARTLDTWEGERVFDGATFSDAPFLDARLMVRGDSGGAVFIQNFLLMVR